MPGKLHDFWMALHRYFGLVAMGFLGFAALTGCGLCFVRPIDAALNADLFVQPVPGAAPAVAPLVDRFAAAYPEWQVASFPLAVPAAARIPVKVAPRADGTDQVFLDRVSGALAGARSDAPALTRRGGARWLHDVHYTLMAGAAGRWLMGAVAGLWLVGNLVGIYLTLPRRGAFWRQWRRIWRFSFKSAFPRLMLDLHRAPGLWLTVPFAVLAFTSVAMNFFAEGYAPLLDRLVPEATVHLPARIAAPPGPLDMARAVAQARIQAAAMGEAWQPASVVVHPAAHRLGVTLSGDGVLGYRDLGPVYLWFDARTGRLVDTDNPYDGDVNLALVRLLYPLHSGRVLGAPTVALVFVAGLATLAMCVTGGYLWWKRRPGRVARRRRT